MTPQNASPPPDAPGSSSELETLRQVLRLMTAHAGDYRPPTYAVWHAYVNGGNPVIKERLLPWIERGARVPPELSDDLYLHAILDARERALVSVQARMQALVDGLAASATEAASDAGVLATTLRGFDPVALARESREALERSLKAIADVASAREQSLVRAKGRLEVSRLTVSAVGDEITRLGDEDLSIDPASGLPNRRRFEQQTAARIADAPDRTLSVVLLEIDDYVALHHAHGRHVCDQIVGGVSQAMQKAARPESLAARLADDAFGWLLPDLSTPAAEDLAEFVRRIVERGRSVDYVTHDVLAQATVSAGVATRRATETMRQFLDRAEAALHQAKRLGKNTVCRAR